MVATTRTRPQEAFLEQSRTVLGWLQGLPAETFDRRTVLPAWTVRQLIGHLVHLHAGFLRIAGSADQRHCAPDP